jgi:predicted MFS family arabinose efflux permease
MFAVNVTMALFVIKGNAGGLGKEPFGYAGQEKREGNDPLSVQESMRDLGLGEAMRTYSFWLFLFAMFICGSGDFFVTTHLIPYVTDHGISPTTGGNMLAWFGLMALGGVLVAGPASDLIGNKIPLALTFLMRFLSFLLILNYQTTVSFYVFSLSFGFTYLITGTLIPTTMGRLYGFLHIGLLSGFVTTVHHLGGGFWAYMGGFIFDRTGSYRLVFILSTLMALIAFFFCIFLKEKRHLPTEDI